MAKKFFYVCLGVLALACAYAIGADNSVAQIGGSDVVHFRGADAAGGLGYIAVTANGDIYAVSGIIGINGGQPYWTSDVQNWTHMGNVFAGAVSSQQNTLGGVKSIFR